MRLNTDFLQTCQKTVGTVGTLGTASNHAGFSRPQVQKTIGDTGDKKGAAGHLSPMSPTPKTEWGRKKVNNFNAVPNVPNVPNKKQSLCKKVGIRDAQDMKDDYEERAAIMEYEGGLPREEAERLAWGMIYGDEAKS